MTTHEESVERAELLAKALESGDFKQTTGCLNNHFGFCCLGVATEVYRRAVNPASKWIECTEDPNGMRQFRGEGFLIVAIVCKILEEVKHFPQ